MIDIRKEQSVLTNFITDKSKSIVSPTQIIYQSGIGLHSGKPVQCSITPMPWKYGSNMFIFDGEGLIHNKIRITPFSVVDTTLCTVVGLDQKNQNYRVSTIEHLMAALWAYDIRSCYIYASSSEIPILDGSSRPWIYLLEKSFEVAKHTKEKSIIIKDTIRVELGDSFLEVSPYDGFYTDITIDFPYKSIGRASYSSKITPSHFIKDISHARTFVHKKDALYLRMNGMALGGSMDNAIVVDDETILNPEGLITKNEFVKHKVLDLIGDLWTLGTPIWGKITGYKPGHKINNMMARAIYDAYLKD